MRSLKGICINSKEALFSLRPTSCEVEYKEMFYKYVPIKD